MITQIQLGNFFSENGRNVVSGSASGLDIKGLVDGLATAKRQPAVLLETKVTNNEKVSTALTTFKKKLQTMEDAANFLRNPPGVANAADNIFDFRKASVSSNSSVSGDTYVNITAVPGAAASQYQINVNSLATHSNYTTNTFALTDADTSAVGGTGPFNAGILHLGASGTAITLTAGDTLNNVVAKVNAVKSTSGVEASIIKVSNGNYRVAFKSVDTGTATNYSITGLNPGIFNVGFATSTLATDASITFDNTTITRSSNSIDDIVTGVTFNLLQATPPGTNLTVDIAADHDLAKQGILNFVNAYNDLKLYASQQTALGDDGQPLADSVLANNPTLTTTFTRLNAELSGAVNGITSGDPSRLSELGITFGDFPGDDKTPFTRNILTVDDDKLTAVLASNFDKVRKVFEFDSVSDNANLQVFKRTNALSVSDVSLNINRTSGVYQATYGTTTVTLDSQSLSDGSLVLTGPKGSSIEDLMMIYADPADATVHVQLTQGIGDRAWNALDGLLTKDTGVVDVAINSLASDNTRYKTEITKIDDQVDKYRDQLLDKFAALEKAISSANTLLQSLDAQANAQANN